MISWEKYLIVEGGTIDTATRQLAVKGSSGAEGGLVRPVLSALRRAWGMALKATNNDMNKAYALIEDHLNRVVGGRTGEYSNRQMVQKLNRDQRHQPQQAQPQAHEPPVNPAQAG